MNTRATTRISAIDYVKGHWWNIDRMEINMLKKHYEIERQGQMDFFDNYGIDYRGDNSILVDNTDGI